MKMVCHNRPAVAWLVSFACGLMTGARLPGLSPAIAVASVVGAGWLIWCIHRNRCGRTTPLLLLVAMGYLAIQPWVNPQFPENHVIHYIGEKRWDLVCTVATRPVQKTHYRRYIVSAHQIRHKGSHLSVVGKIRLTVPAGQPKFHQGDTLSFKARLRSIENFNNPGGFDYKRYLAFKGVWVKAYTKGADLVPADRPAVHGVERQIERFRERVAVAIEKAAHGNRGAVLKALLIGDRSQISKNLRDAFNRTGIGHLLAISGLHIGIVATVAYLCLAWMTSRSAYLLESGAAPKWAAGLTLIPITAYALLAGMTPSTQRALIMVAIMMLTIVIEREHDMVNNLSIAALVILILHPPALYAISFQLSFSSVFAIVCGMACCDGIFRRLQNAMSNPLAKKGLRWLATLFLVSLWAMAGSLPWVMRYFNQVSLVGLFANVVMVPLIGGVVVPLGLFAVFAMLFSDALAAMGFIGCQSLLSPALNMIEKIGEMPWAAVKTVTPSAIEISCYYLLLWALFNMKNNDAWRFCLRWPLPPFPSLAAERGRRRGGPHSVLCLHWAGLVAGLALLAMVLDVSYWVHRRYVDTDLEITVLDVGHGHAALLKLPSGNCALIDGGGFADNAIFDVGERVVAPFLWRQKIMTVDLLILSHPNADHLNGLIYIAEHFNVGTVWTNDEPRSTIGYRRLMQTIAQKGVQRPAYAELPSRWQLNGVQFQLLHPPVDFLQRRASEPWRTTNNNSIVLKVTYGKTSFLFPGDISAAAEKELVARKARALKCDVLLVPHHGSNSSSTASFLKEVDAGYAVVSAGKYRAGFPNPLVIERLSACGPTIYRTDRNGAVRLISNGRRLEVVPFLQSVQN